MKFHMCEVCVNAHFGQLHLNAHPGLKLFPGCTCQMQQAGGGGAAAAGGGVWAGAPGGGGGGGGAAAAPARTEWEAADRHFQGLPIGRQDAKAVRSLILRRSLLLMGSHTGKLAEVVIVSRGAGRTPMGLIAAMLSIPFSDPDFTAPDLPVATLTHQRSGHRGPVLCVAVLPDGRFVTGSGDNTVKVWKESSSGSGQWSVEATLTHQLSGHRKWVSCVAVLADGRFVTGSGDFTVKVWKESSPGSGVWSVEATLTGHGRCVWCVAALPPLPFGSSLVPVESYGVEAADGSTSNGAKQVRFVTGSFDNTVKVWKESWPGSGMWSVEATLTGHSNPVSCVAVLPPLRSYGVEDADGPTSNGAKQVRFVTGSRDNTVKVRKESSPGSGQWSVEATLTHQRSGHRGAVFCVAVLADGRFAIGSADKRVRVCVESSLQRLSTTRGRLATPQGGAREPRRGGGSPKERSGVWSVEATLTGYSTCVRCVAVLADGRLATGSQDGTVKVWG